MTASSPDIATWIAGGDVRRAATWLVESLADDVYAMCRAMVRDPVVAEDLAQDAFSRAISALPGFRGDASPRTWLLAITRNRCLDHLRRQGIDPTDDDDASEEHADPAPADVHRVLARADLERGLAVLSETDRALVVLRHGQGLSYTELAAAFGIREGTARMRVSRALGRVREALEAPPPVRAVGRSMRDLGEAAAAVASRPRGRSRARVEESEAPARRPVAAERASGPRGGSPVPTPGAAPAYTRSARSVGYRAPRSLRKRLATLIDNV